MLQWIDSYSSVQIDLQFLISIGLVYIIIYINKWVRRIIIFATEYSTLCVLCCVLVSDNKTAAGIEWLSGPAS